MTSDEDNSVEIKKEDKSKPDEEMVSLVKKLGNVVRTNRTQCQISIEKLAEYLDLSPSYIGLLERGERVPSLKTTCRLCKVFELTPNEIMGIEEAKIIENKDLLARENSIAITEIINVLNEHGHTLKNRMFDFTED